MGWIAFSQQSNLTGSSSSGENIARVIDSQCKRCICEITLKLYCISVCVHLLQVFQKELGKRTGSVQALKRSARELIENRHDDSSWVKVQMQELSLRWETVCSLSVLKQTRLEQSLCQVHNHTTLQFSQVTFCLDRKFSLYYLFIYFCTCKDWLFIFSIKLILLGSIFLNSIL